MECSLLVRSAGSEDMDAVEAIEVSSFTNPYPRWFLELLLALAGGKFLVAELCGRIAGYAVAVTREGGVCHLVSIAVAAPLRGRRIGAALLASIEQLCVEDGAVAVTLEVEAGNEPAIRLYRGFGFLELGMLPDYYGPGRHAHLMAKPLCP